MSLFVEKYPRFFNLNLPDSLEPERGRKVSKWSFGFKYTGTNRRGEPMTDGTPSQYSFVGMPWVKELPKSDARLSILISSVSQYYFKRPTDLVFVDDSSSGVARPRFVAVREEDVWFLVGDAFNLRTESEFRYLAERGLISGARGLTVSVKDMTESDYAAVGCRHFPGFGTYRISRPTSGVCNFISGYSPENVPGIKVLSINKVYSNGFEPNDFIVTDPSLAAMVHPLFGRFPAGSSLRVRRGGDHAFRASDFSNDFIAGISSLGTVFVDFTNEPLIVLAIHKIPSSLTCKPVREYGHDLFAGSDLGDLVPHRKVAKKYPHIPKYRLHLFGESSIRNGYFCLPSEIAEAIPIDDETLKQRRAKYKWFTTPDHLKFSDADLESHQSYLTKNSQGWIGLNNSSSKDSFESTLSSIVSKYFLDDARVVCMSPLSPQVPIYKHPSMEVLAEHPEALYEVLSSFRKFKPELFDVFSNFDFKSILMAGDISA